MTKKSLVDDLLGTVTGRPSWLDRLTAEQMQELHTIRDYFNAGQYKERHTATSLSKMLTRLWGVTIHHSSLNGFFAEGTHGQKSEAKKPSRRITTKATGRRS